VNRVAPGEMSTETIHITKVAMTDQQPINVAALYAMIGKLTIENQVLKTRLEQAVAAAGAASETEPAEDGSD